MKRREFLIVAGAAAALPRVASGQQIKPLPHIAFLWNAGTRAEYISAYQQGLEDFGYADGRNVVVETYSVASAAELPATAMRVVAARPDVIVINGGTVATALKAATTTIPIVFGAVGDAIGDGLTQSLAHPTANFTGLTILAPDLVGKQLGLLAEIVPGLRRIVKLNPVATLSTAVMLAAEAAAATALALELVSVDFVETREFGSQFGPVVAAVPQAIYAPPSVYLSANSALIADLQIQYRLPLIWSNTNQPRALISYGVDGVAQARKTGAYVDAILRGAKPADLPIEQASKFVLAINLTTAKAIGITVPQSILYQATELIQ